MPAEVEAKFLADGPDPLRALAEETRLGDAELGPPRTFDEVDRYLDTADGRLAAEGWACRLRERDGAVRVSLKGPGRDGDDGWLHRRDELEAPATSSTDPAGWQPSAARDAVRALAGGGVLVERFRLLQRRTERTVVADGKRLGTLTLDDVTIAAAGDDVGRMFAVELELNGSASESIDVLAGLADVLSARSGLTADPLSKLEHALAAIGAA
jgi:inorganic triphosphatase YgiF